MKTECEQVLAGAEGAGEILWHSTVCVCDTTTHRKQAPHFQEAVLGRRGGKAPGALAPASGGVLAQPRQNGSARPTWPCLAQAPDTSTSRHTTSCGCRCLQHTDELTSGAGLEPQDLPPAARTTRNLNVPARPVPPQLGSSALCHFPCSSACSATGTLTEEQAHFSVSSAAG